ncbi:MAG TPA: GNAT family N-acetyltransferase, partial [Pirellulales bacterium]|nr:GNAT family N-acetyltransferase [Pirellulales bacterium]
PFRSWEWLGAWWRHYGLAAGESSGRRLFALAMRDAGQRLIGLAPWYIQPHPVRGDVVRFLGSGDVCSDYLSILCLPGCEDAVATALADWLCSPHQHAEQPWDLLELMGVDAADGVTGRLIDELRRREATVDSQTAVNCWRIRLPNSWDEYLALVSKSHRKQLRRLERRIFESGRATIHTIATPGDLDHGLNIVSGLHQRRRAELGHAGRFADPRFAAFHREVAGQMLRHRRLRLTWIELDGRPVAAEYQLCGSDVIYAYQSGIDPEMLAEQPGRLAMIATLRQAIDEGYRAFDLLRGDEAYKAHWRAEPRPSLDVCIVPPHGPARLRQKVWLAGRQMRSWLREKRRRAESLMAKPNSRRLELSHASAEGRTTC